MTKEISKKVNMRSWRNHSFFLILLTIIGITIVYIILASCYFVDSSQEDHKHNSLVELLWWTDVPGKYFVKRDCGHYQCIVSNNRKRQKLARGLLFYGSNMEVCHMPMPRSKYKFWALLHEESPRNVPYLPYNEFLQHFNFTSTFSRYSQLPLTTQYLPYIGDLSSSEYVIDFDSKVIHSFNDGFSPIAFLQSDCDTMSGREDFVRELMQHIRIDSYGACLHNRDLPQSLQKDYLNNLYTPQLLMFLSKYKFMLAIENGVCEDYITEKFWRPLVMGVIPVYFGAPNIKDWQPNNHSVIYISDYKSPAKLAKYLLKLNNQSNEYNAYLSHKSNQNDPIQNKHLLSNLLRRQYSMADKDIFKAFECNICKRITSFSETEQPLIANTAHYNCPMPPVTVPLTNRRKPANALQWQSILAVGRCQAKLLNQYWSRNENCSMSALNKALEHMVATNLCN